jgi:prepilin-type N-terminal cleavage/methylation domain-containing protein
MVKVHGKRRQTAQAFTLIELLVVIAIIALLVAILLPSLEAARRQAKQNACLSHIKNIASSSLVYEADDPSGWSIPVHPLQYNQCPEQSTTGCTNPTFIGAYEYGGKSGIGRDDFVANYSGTIYGSKYGTAAGFGPATRPLNRVLYGGGMTDYGSERQRNFNRTGGKDDTELELELYRCPGDNGPPRAAHCPDWVANRDRSSYDHFGTSYAANIFMIKAGESQMYSNSPYLRPTSRVPTPARTLYYEENIGRWAWSCRKEQDAQCEEVTGGPGVDPGPTKAVAGWHGRDWTYNRAFVDAHAEYQKVYLEGTEDKDGYAKHYRSETLDCYPPLEGGPCERGQGPHDEMHCIIVRGDGWQKDTLPSPTIPTNLYTPCPGRPSYECCVEPMSGG